MAEVIVVRVESEIDVGKARRAAAVLCRQADFSAVDAGCVVTSVSELASNVWRHAGGGIIRLGLEDEEHGPAVVVIAEDAGPGIAEVDRALQNGFSTGGSLGSGLPGVRRLMDELEIQTSSQGTRIIARKRATRQPGRRS